MKTRLSSLRCGAPHEVLPMVNLQAALVGSIFGSTALSLLQIAFDNGWFFGVYVGLISLCFSFPACLLALVLLQPLGRWLEGWLLWHAYALLLLVGFAVGALVSHVLLSTLAPWLGCLFGVGTAGARIAGDWQVRLRQQTS